MMKIKVLKAHLVSAMKHMDKVMSSKPSLQIVANVMFNARGDEVIVTATDLDITCVAHVSCEVVEDGSTTIPYRLLFAAIQNLPEGVVEIETNQNEVSVVKAGYSVFNIHGLAASEFPRLPVVSDTTTFTLPQATLREMFRKVVYARSTDETRRVLKSVLMSFKNDKLRMVATDGRRMSLVDYGVEVAKDTERDIILPSKSVDVIQKVLSTEGDVTISVENTQCSLTMGNVKVYTKMVDEVFPNYANVIPKGNDKAVVFDRQELMRGINCVSIFVDARNTATVKFSIKDGAATITSATADVGDAKDVIPVKYDGEPLEILFNPFYITDVLSAIDDDEVKFEFKDGHSPATIKCSSPFLGVVMPVRVN